ncbi:MAG: hypothetical protein QM755_21870 [Luteolibacter sp.]
MSLKPAADPAAAALEALARSPRIRAGEEDDEATVSLRAEIAVRVLQWMEADSKAALAYFSEGENLTICASDAVEIWAKETPSVRLFEFLTTDVTAGSVCEVILSGLETQIGEAADLAGLEKLHGLLPKEGWSNVFTNLVEKWPFGPIGRIAAEGDGDGRWPSGVRRIRAHGTCGSDRADPSSSGNSGRYRIPQE